MMNERLKLARQLLKNTGVIFISIDDKEQAYLKVLCDEVFGEGNFVGTFIWRKKEGGGQTKEYFVIEHEYVLTYRKSEEFRWIDDMLEDDEASYNKRDDNGNKYKLMKLAKWGNTARKEDRPKMHFPITAPDGSKVIPYAPDGSLGRWRVGSARMAILLENDLVEFVKDNDGKWLAYEKIYFDENGFKSVKERSIIYDLTNTADASKQLTEIFGKKDVFDTPKPLDLIKYFLSHTTDKDSIILDFFAGSGTTGQAVMELNEEDKGKRRFILCTNNENNIAKNITRERLYRIINGKGSKGEKIKWEYKPKQKSLINNQVRVFEIKHNSLTLDDLQTAEKLKKQAEAEFKKLNPDYKTNNDFDIYNELSALNPYKDEE
jgi:adenine-specific DNA-methyltransferase